MFIRDTIENTVSAVDMNVSESESYLVNDDQCYAFIVKDQSDTDQHLQIKFLLVIFILFSVGREVPIGKHLL